MSETVRLEKDQKACRWCGCRAPDGSHVWEYGAVSVTGKPYTRLYGLCVACEALHEHAKEVVEGFSPGEREQLGESPVGQVAAVFRAGDVLDLAVDQTLMYDDWETLTYYVVRALARAGWPDGPVRLAWEDQGRDASYSATRWGWVSDKTKKHLEDAFSAVDDETVALAGKGPVSLTPPDLVTGCGWCGVGTVELDAKAAYRLGDKAARRAWTQRRAGPGWLCHACAPHPTSRAALLDTAGVLAEVVTAEHSGLRLGLPQWRRWRGAGAQPTDQPWTHIGDLENVAAQVRQAIKYAQDAETPETDRKIADLEAKLERLEARG